MKHRFPFRFSVIAILTVLSGFARSIAFAAPTLPALPAGWRTGAPRAEIMPTFSFEPDGGRDGRGCFVIVADAQPGRHGYWTRTFAVQGGKHYQFRVWRKVDGLEQP